VAVFFSLRIGLFTIFASVHLLLFLDDAPFSKSNQARADAPIQQNVAVRGFVPLHLVLIGLASLGHVALGLRQPLAARVLLNPLVMAYTRTLTGFAYYDVWNSRFMLNPVRFIYYEARHPNGEPAALEPFDEKGGFSPPLSYFTEVREGVLSMKLASMPAPPAVWQAYVRYLLHKYRQQYQWLCPAELRVYRIAAPMRAFGEDPRRLGVPKRLILTATPRCQGDRVELILTFDHHGS
jgi:hypothetical protein